MGLRPARRELVRASLVDPLDSPDGKRQFRRGFLDRAAGSVSLVGPPGSHFLRWLAGADCLIELAEDVTHLDAGSLVDVWPID